jgi:hypothetical protein
MTTLTPVLEGFELDNPTVEERLLNLERALGFAPTAEDPLAQCSILDQVIGVQRRLTALQNHLRVSNRDLFGAPRERSLGAPPVEP